jgi:inosine-uridine nucleoside N-ribohydrolase
VSDLIERALAGGSDPLYVVAIGAITNVASAILLEPSVIEKIVVVWLGGNAHQWPHTKEFNLAQDLHAARLMFDCGVPLVQVPCWGVTTHVLTTVPELEQYVAGRGEIGDYLVEIFKAYREDHYAWSKVLWDLAAVAYLIDSSWVPTHLVPSPRITDKVTWSFDAARHLIRVAGYVHRDPIFKDLFTKLNQTYG